MAEKKVELYKILSIDPETSIYNTPGSGRATEYVRRVKALDRSGATIEFPFVPASKFRKVEDPKSIEVSSRLSWQLHPGRYNEPGVYQQDVIVSYRVY